MHDGDAGSGPTALRIEPLDRTAEILDTIRAEL